MTTYLINDTHTIPDVYRWVKKVIESCNTIDQLNSAKNLIKLFNTQLPTDSKTWKLFVQSLEMIWHGMYVDMKLRGKK